MPTTPTTPAFHPKTALAPKTAAPVEVVAAAALRVGEPEPLLEVEAVPDDWVEVVEVVDAEGVFDMVGRASEAD